MFRPKDRIQVKTPEQVELMRAAGLVVAGALELLRGAPAAGRDHRASSTRWPRRTSATTAAVPSFLGYPYTGENDFPATICASVNDEIVHGIPGPRVLRDGDLVSIDCGAIVDGWHGDAASRRRSARCPADQVELLRATEDALWAGLAAAQVGGRLTDISHAVEARPARAAAGYGIVEEYVGHGIGTEMHMDPQVPNFGPPGRGPRLVAGHGPGGRADGHPGPAADPRAGRRLDRGHRGRQPGGPLRAHRRAHRRRARGSSPRSTAERPGSGALGVATPAGGGLGRRFPSTPGGAVAYSSGPFGLVPRARGWEATPGAPGSRPGPDRPDQSQDRTVPARDD